MFVEQLVVRNRGNADGLCAGAAVSHLADVEVAAVGYVVFLLIHAMLSFALFSLAVSPPALQATSTRLMVTTP